MDEKASYAGCTRLRRLTADWLERFEPADVTLAPLDRLAGPGVRVLAQRLSA